MYALPAREGLARLVETAGTKIKSVTRTVGNFVKNKSIVQSVAGITFGSGSYEEATDYRGRVLISVEIEDREGSKVCNVL